MSDSTGTTPVPAIARPRTGRALLVVVVVLVLLFGTVIAVLVGSTFFPNTKNIPSYTGTVSGSTSSPTSLTVEDTNGQIILTHWTGSNVAINATVTARGLGSSPDAVTFDRSGGPDAIVFKALFPRVLGIIPVPSYTVDINVYVPEDARFGPVTITNTNGQIKADGLNATSVTLTTTNGIVQATEITANSLTITSTNGNVEFSCLGCSNVDSGTTNGAVTGTLQSLSATGSYHLGSTNGAITLKVPGDSAFKLSAHTTNGKVSLTLPGSNTQTGNSLDTTIGNGTASLDLTTTNGNITINSI